MATINTAWDHVNQNIFKTWLVMFFFSLFTVAIIYLFARAWGYDAIGGVGITGIALIITGIMNFVSYYFSDQIVLAAAKAQKIESNDQKSYGNFTGVQIYRIVENLCIASGLPVPKIYVIDDTALNAFATGRDPKHAAIAFTIGILQKLDKHEIEGVAAHELSHVGNRDTLLMSVVSILVGTLALVSDWFLRSLWYRNGDDNRNNTIFLVIGIAAAVLSPIIATLIQLAVSRRRELLADASGVLMTRYPQGLASALQKISGDKEVLEVANRGTAHMYIANPLKGAQAVGWLAGLFNTHPPVEVRLKALREMEGHV